MGNKPSAAAAEQTVSEPYPPLNPAPPGWSLSHAFTVTRDQDGHVYAGDGHVRFVDQTSYDRYVQEQTSLGGTPTQLAALHTLITTGDVPHVGPVTSAPPGTTADALLDVRGKKPNGNGFYELGTLRVHQNEYAEFKELQSTLCNRNPEARDMLYHMQHAREPITFRVTNQEMSSYRPDNATIYWNPRAASRDAQTGARISPATAALHEEAHWALGEVGDVLTAVPSGMFGTVEEQRAVQGIEARDQQRLHRPQRGSHFGDRFPVNKIDSISPSLTIVNGNGRNSVGGPWRQSGFVRGVTDHEVTLAKYEDPARTSRQDAVLNLEEMGNAMGGPQNAKALFEVAQLNRDQITVELSSDGRLSYTNDAHERRFGLYGGGVPPCPRPMWKQFEAMDQQIQRDSPQPSRRASGRGR